MDSARTFNPFYSPTPASPSPLPRNKACYSVWEMTFDLYLSGERIREDSITCWRKSLVPDTQEHVVQGIVDSQRATKQWLRMAKPVGDSVGEKVARREEEEADGDILR